MNFKNSMKLIYASRRIPAAAIMFSKFDLRALFNVDFGPKLR